MEAFVKNMIHIEEHNRNQRVGRKSFEMGLNHLADLVRARGLALETGGENGTVEMYCTDVEEDGKGGFVYVHKLRKGINRKSHALKVARLAGLPEPAINMARNILNYHDMGSAGVRQNTGQVGSG